MIGEPNRGLMRGCQDNRCDALWKFFLPRWETKSSCSAQQLDLTISVNCRIFTIWRCLKMSIRAAHSSRYFARVDATLDPGGNYPQVGWRRNSTKRYKTIHALHALLARGHVTGNMSLSQLSKWQNFMYTASVRPGLIPNSKECTLFFIRT